jgi:hypothetical protein
MKRGDIFEAPWNEEETVWYQVRVESSSVTKKGSHASVVWLAGPLKGREARIATKSMRATKGAQKCVEEKGARQSRRASRSTSRKGRAIKKSRKR